jgi:hypothetical protein
MACPGAPNNRGAVIRRWQGPGGRVRRAPVFRRRIRQRIQSLNDGILRVLTNAESIPAMSLRKWTTPMSSVSRLPSYRTPRKVPGCSSTRLGCCGRQLRADSRYVVFPRLRDRHYAGPGAEHGAGDALWRYRHSRYEGDVDTKWIKNWRIVKQVHAEKKKSGRGAHASWTIPHTELLRFQRKRMLPLKDRVD